jgi:hypothetical protein
LIKINYVGCQTLILPLRSFRCAASLFISVITPTQDRPPNEVRRDGCHTCMSLASLRMSRSNGDERQRRAELGLIKLKDTRRSTLYQNLLFFLSEVERNVRYRTLSLPRPLKRRSLFKCPTALEAAMDRFVTRENIKRYSELPSESTDAAERSRIMKFLAGEVAKIKLELRRRGDAPGGRLPVNAATGNRVEYDQEGQRGGG